MGIAALYNTTGYANFMLAINHETSGLLLTGLLFVFFIIVIISLLQFGNRSLWEVSAISGLGAFIPSLLMTTLYYDSVRVIPFWPVIAFGLMMVVGLAGEYFTQKS